ncbi:ribosome maturation factor RimP [Actinophytocola oryzae]|uniref:Ribosome maturation factor RimP n=1 Tax=Actinophytocola oryzae TaxID=502181 RepID=A0A4R7VBG8_9PSEU|nr:ribosome maturation factor RimP [Actinophytocola oryzae]TDV46400.1 ribosome maturation factor RimP [Actinophytocola oryzae]
MPGQRERTGGGSERLEPVVAAAVARAGYELEQVHVQQAGRTQLVKVVVDGDDGIGLDEVADVSRLVSEALDSHDEFLAGAYTLEVTSPGLDRPLTRPRHWRRARLRKVSVRTPEDKFLARVGDADEEGVELLVDGQLRRMGYAEIDHAVIEVEFKEPSAAEIAKLAHEEGSG